MTQDEFNERVLEILNRLIVDEFSTYSIKTGYMINSLRANLPIKKET